MYITISQNIEYQSISDLLCGALEGGSSYWMRIVDLMEPGTWKFEDRPIGENKDKKMKAHYMHNYPLNPGGALRILDKESEIDQEYDLDISGIYQGLDVFAKKFPKHFGDFMAGNADAVTADVFLQCCLFGDVIYG